MISRLSLVALRTCLVTLLLTGVTYPLLVTGFGRLFFSERAGGSLIKDGKGQVIGSSLIAQGFKNPAYFQPRPSAAGDGYDAANSGGSNLGPTSKKLRDRAVADVNRLKTENPDAGGDVPAELVTTSASGLDPHLSLAAVLWQVPRVAKARGVNQERIAKLVEANNEERELGFLGEPKVNVLELNLSLDRLLGSPASSLPAAPR